MMQKRNFGLEHKNYLISFTTTMLISEKINEKINEKIKSFTYANHFNSVWNKNMWWFNYFLNAFLLFSLLLLMYRLWFLFIWLLLMCWFIWFLFMCLLWLICLVQWFLLRCWWLLLNRCLITYLSCVLLEKIFNIFSCKLLRSFYLLICFLFC